MKTHKQTPSDSTASSHASSDGSVSSVISVRSELYKEKVKGLKEGPASLRSLAETATNLISRLKASKQNIYAHAGVDIKLDGLLSAMLEHVEGCCGNAGKGYSTAAIALCVVNDDEGSEDTLHMLRDLAETWISHLLYVCKCEHLSYNRMLMDSVRANGSHKTQMNKTPSPT